MPISMSVSDSIPPSKSDLDGILRVALDVARRAGEVLLEGFGGAPVPGIGTALGRRQRADAKGSSIDLVTEFDRRSETLVVSALQAAFPGDAILAEEGSERPGQGPDSARWIVDPLDGTTNFAHGLPCFCVAIAREKSGRIDVGVVHAPALGLTFTARLGGGAFLNGQRIAVSDTAGLGEAMLATGFPYDRHTSPDNNFDQFIAFQRRVQAVRRLGSAALDLALVAHGTYDGYWEMKLKPWDLAAGALLVTEAGGQVSGWAGEAPSVDRGAIVASNGRLHAAMVEVLAQLGLPPSAQRLG